jgi:hypothetical protein
VYYDEEVPDEQQSTSVGSCCMRWVASANRDDLAPHHFRERLGLAL